MNTPQNPAKQPTKTPGQRDDRDTKNRDQKVGPRPAGASDHQQDPGRKLPVSGDEQAGRDRQDPAERDSRADRSGAGRGDSGSSNRPAGTNPQKDGPVAGKKVGEDGDDVDAGGARDQDKNKATRTASQNNAETRK